MNRGENSQLATGVRRHILLNDLELGQIGFLVIVRQLQPCNSVGVIMTWSHPLPDTRDADNTPKTRNSAHHTTKPGPKRINTQSGPASYRM